MRFLTRSTLRARVSLFVVLASCAGTSSAETECAEALDYVANLHVARASPSGDFADADKHRDALVRATGESFLADCTGRRPQARERYLACVLESKTPEATRRCAGLRPVRELGEAQ